MTVTTRAPSDAGLVVSMRGGAHRTQVDVATPEGIDTVTVPAVPDLAAADRLASVFRRVCWVRITVDEAGRATADVSAIGHRHPLCRDISVSTALGLAGRQVPTVVRRRAASS